MEDTDFPPNHFCRRSRFDRGRVGCFAASQGKGNGRGLGRVVPHPRLVRRGAQAGPGRPPARTYTPIQRESQTSGFGPLTDVSSVKNLSSRFRASGFAGIGHDLLARAF